MQRVVIDTATNVVKRHGFADFENDGVFDPATETVLKEGTEFRGDFPSTLASTARNGPGTQLGRPSTPERPGDRSGRLRSCGAPAAIYLN